MMTSTYCVPSWGLLDPFCMPYNQHNPHFADMSEQHRNDNVNFCLLSIFHKICFAFAQEQSCVERVHG